MGLLKSIFKDMQSNVLCKLIVIISLLSSKYVYALSFREHQNPIT